MEFTYSSDLFLLGDAKDIRRLTTLAVSEFTVLAAKQLVIHPTERVASDYFC